MKKIKRILFPLDFSTVSPTVVPWVNIISRKFKSDIHLLFVARRLSHFSNLNIPETSINFFEAEIVNAGRLKMQQFLKSHFQNGTKIKSNIVVGDAAEEILKYIKTENITLVIIGSHGRKRLNRILFGSVADRVIKNAHAPVLCINPYKIPEHLLI